MGDMMERERAVNSAAAAVLLPADIGGDHKRTSSHIAA